MCKKVLLVSLLALAYYASYSQVAPSDTTAVSDRGSRRNVMLNAYSASQPRIISLGMPQWGTQIMEDGLPTSMYMAFFPGFWSWHNGLGTEQFHLTTLDESAIELGDAGYYVSSVSKTGGQSFRTAASYTMNNHGRHVIDVNISAPLGRGWGINLNVFQDLDRGPNHLDASYLQQHIQYYKAAASKSFADGRGKLRLLYQFMDTYSFIDSYGPFVFVGDGSIREYEGFRLGRDQYLPATASFDYMDVESGVMKSRRFAEDCSIPMHTGTVSLDRVFLSGTKLSVVSHLKSGGCNLAEPGLSSIEKASATGIYTYPDGSPYTGDVQTRYLVFHAADYKDWMTTARLNGKFRHHDWTVGANFWMSRNGDQVSTSNFAYEVKANPKALLYNGELYYVHNTGAQYYQGTQSRTATFFRDDWTVVPSVVLRTGLRLEYDAIRGSSANNLDGLENNTRGAGWNLSSPGVTITPMKANNFNWAASLVGLWRIGKPVTLELDAIATQQHSEMWQYGEAPLPSQLPIRTFLFRAGINYKQSWIDMQSMLTYIRKANNYLTSLWSHELIKDAGGFPAGYVESLYVPSIYSMDAWGWTTDVVLTPFMGFSFHGLLTLRAPRYRDYRFEPVFSDGVQLVYDFSGKSITGTSPVEIELEPSYEYRKWRIWLSARYYGKSYINITNTLFFKPHWETFGGIDFAMNDHVSFSLNVVNFLNQIGASAGIQEASLTVDPTPFFNYLTSGSFIRPFTLEMGIKIQL